MRGERGVILLEVLVALTILATAGTGLAGTVGEALHRVEEARVREARFTGAWQVMARLALRDRRGLDIRLGIRREGSMVTRVDRPRPDLYRLAVSDSADPESPLFVTVVYRPEIR